MSDHRLDDDEDREGYENPTIEVLDRDLTDVLNRTDLRLLVFIGIALLAVHLPDYVKMPPLAESILQGAAGVFLIGSIGFTIYSAIQRRHRVARRYGVVCRTCGYRPEVNAIVSTADLGLCPKCGAELRVRRP